MAFIAKLLKNVYQKKHLPLAVRTSMEYAAKVVDFQMIDFLLQFHASVVNVGLHA